MARIVAAGFCCIDEYEALGLHYPTGNGVDCLIHLSRMGHETGLVSAVGDDAYGEELLQAVAAEGIDTAYIQRLPGATSRFIMALQGNDRVHVKNIKGVMADFQITPQSSRYIESFDYIHSDFAGNCFQYFPRWRQAGCRIFFDFSKFYDLKEEAKDIIGDVDYAFLSCGEEARDIEAYIAGIQGLGPKIVTATLGEHGSIAYDGRHFYSQQALPATVVNTVGAGDSYIAGFMDGVIRGLDVAGCMRCGAELASQVVAKFPPY